MFRFPNRIHKFISQILGFLFVVSSTLFANWLWQKYTDKMEVQQAEAEEHQLFISLLHKVIAEIEYNGGEGIGDAKCPFKLQAHHELMEMRFKKCLAVSNQELAKEIIRMASLCNGGRTGRKVSASLVKSKWLALKEELQKHLDQSKLDPIEGV